MSQNLVEKIVQRFLAEPGESKEVHSGDFVTVRPRHVMTHDNTSAVMVKFRSLGAKQMDDSSQPVFTLDHNVQDKSPANLEKYASIAAFAKKMGVDFYPAGRGIGHQIMIEEGYAWPGTFVVASDSHSNVYGGIGALGTPVVRTDAAALWATGKTWWQIPPVTKVLLQGSLPLGVTGKDVIITLCGLYNQDEVLNHVLEFHGDGVRQLSLEQRLTIANMTTEWGALAGVFPCDDQTLAWYKQQKNRNPRFSEEAIDALQNPLVADEDANYFQVLRVDLSQISAHVCGPDTVKTMQSVASLEPQKIKIDKAYLLSCTNARVEDLGAAAKVITGKKVDPRVKFYVAAASDVVQAESEKRGDWQKLLDAGAIPLPAGCGPCIGMGEGLLEDGEVGISATNRNFKGRMGSREAKAYLASPAVVAASAIQGYICAAHDSGQAVPQRDLLIPERPMVMPEPTPILEGFPQQIEGRVLFCNADSLNTDGIYPGKYTYREDLSEEEMAAVAMENYDPEFQSLAAREDILLSGYNFGTGSSREQAATALAYRGIRLVVAGSFSATYKRNAFNNGYLLVDCPALVDWVRANISTSSPTQVLEGVLQLNFQRGEAKFQNQRFPFAPLGPTAQELILAGGLEALVRKRLTEG